MSIARKSVARERVSSLSQEEMVLLVSLREALAEHIERDDIDGFWDDADARIRATNAVVDCERLINALRG